MGRGARRRHESPPFSRRWNPDQRQSPGAAEEKTGCAHGLPPRPRRGRIRIVDDRGSGIVGRGQAGTGRTGGRYPPRQHDALDGQKGCAADQGPGTRGSLRRNYLEKRPRYGRSRA